MSSELNAVRRKCHFNVRQHNNQLRSSDSFITSVTGYDVFISFKRMYAKRKVHFLSTEIRE